MLFLQLGELLEVGLPALLQSLQRGDAGLYADGFREGLLLADVATLRLDSIKFILQFDVVLELLLLEAGETGLSNLVLLVTDLSQDEDKKCKKREQN